MIDLLNIIGFLFVCLLIWQFWLFRTSTEKAMSMIRQYCETHHLQLVSVARTSQKLKRSTKGHLNWLVEYQFEFSSNGENKYTATMSIFGDKALSFDVPPYATEHFH